MTSMTSIGYCMIACVNPPWEPSASNCLAMQFQQDFLFSFQFFIASETNNSYNMIACVNATFNRFFKKASICFTMQLQQECFHLYSHCYCQRDQQYVPHDHMCKHSLDTKCFKLLSNAFSIGILSSFQIVIYSKNKNRYCMIACVNTNFETDFFTNSSNSWTMQFQQDCILLY